jgi:sec-independent protein translocase protein TatA
MSPSIWQILIVVGIIAILFVPSRLPGLAKSLRESMKEFKKGLNDDEIDVTELSKQVEGEEKATEKTSDKEAEKQS